MDSAEIAGLERKTRSIVQDRGESGNRDDGRRSAVTTSLAGSAVTADGAPDAPTNLRGNVNEGEIGPKPSRGGKIARLPNRLELSLESAQTLKIVEATAQRPNQATEAMPSGRQAMGIKARKRYHPQAEAMVTLFVKPLYETHEKILHRVTRGVAGCITHQTDGHFVADLRRHHRREGDGFAVLAQQRDTLRKQVIALEGGDRKALFASRGMLVDPRIGDALDLVHDRGHLLGRDHFELQAITLATFDSIAQFSVSGAFEGEIRE